MCMEMVFTCQFPTKGSGHTASKRIPKWYPCSVIWSNRIDHQSESSTSQTQHARTRQKAQYSQQADRLQPSAVLQNSQQYPVLWHRELALETDQVSSVITSPDRPMCRCGSRKNWRCCPNQPASHDFPNPGWPLHLGLSDRQTSGIKFVYGAYIRHYLSHLTVVVAETDFPRQQLFEAIYRRLGQLTTVISRYLLPV